jgi:hypothetical protein
MPESSGHKIRPISSGLDDRNHRNRQWLTGSSNAHILRLPDEIGKMELFSNRFRNFVCDALNADKQLLATIPLKGNDFIREID